jgi:MoxR-like ATPase
VADLAPDVMRHRIVLTYDGIANGVTADSIVKAVLQRFQPPRIDLGDKHVA